GRTMRIPDSMLPQWYDLVLEREPPDGEPMEAKLELARRLVRRSHGAEAARAAEAHFTRVVRERGQPQDIAEHLLPTSESTHLPALLVEYLGVTSTSEARRLIDQGAVRLDGEPVGEYDVPTSRLD